MSNPDDFATDKKKISTIIFQRCSLSTIRNADNIVVLSKGQIVESGRHDEVRKK
jgi:ABC-type transport system involved in Fe-S cluster assembly fused permease/ATPase subunit